MNTPASLYSTVVNTLGSRLRTRRTPRIFEKNSKYFLCVSNRTRRRCLMKEKKQSLNISWHCPLKMFLREHSVACKRTQLRKIVWVPTGTRTNQVRISSCLALSLKKINTLYWQNTQKSACVSRFHLPLKWGENDDKSDNKNGGPKKTCT